MVASEICLGRCVLIPNDRLEFLLLVPEVHGQLDDLGILLADLHLEVFNQLLHVPHLLGQVVSRRLDLVDVLVAS